MQRELQKFARFAKNTEKGVFTGIKYSKI